MGIKIAIVGSRSFSSYPVLKMSVWQVIGLLKINPQKISFNSGRAKGADRLGEQFAKSLDAPVFYYIPEWNKLGKRAGMKRNIEMSNDSDIIIAYWDGTSPGTAQMIEYSIRQNKTVFVFNFEGKLVSRHDRKD